MGRKDNCSGCDKLFNRKSLYLKKGKLVCGWCRNKGRTMIYQRDVKKIPKVVIEGQKNYRKLKKVRPSKELPIIPVIPGVKKPRSFRGSPYQHFYITKVERQVLYKKYVSNGLSEDQARTRLNGAIEHLKIFIEKMKKKGVEEKEINKKFKEEFAKLTEIK